MTLQFKNKSLFSFFTSRSIDIAYRHYSERIAYQYSSAQSYISIFEKYKNMHTVSSDIEIKYADSLEFGVSLKEVKRLLKASYVIINNKKSTNTKILFCKLLLGGKKAKIDMHFCEDKLFFYNYTFSYLNSNDKEILRSIFLRKYLSGKQIHGNIFKDNKGNIISIDDSFEFKISYLSPNCSCYNYFLKLKREEEFLRIKKYETQFHELYASI